MGMRTSRHLHPGAIPVRERSQGRSHEVYSYDSTVRRLGQRALDGSEKEMNAPDDDGLCLCAVEAAHAGDDGPIGGPAVDAVGLEGAGGDGEAREGVGEGAGPGETGEAASAETFCVEDVGDVRGGGGSAALDVVQHHGGALARHGRQTQTLRPGSPCQIKAGEGGDRRQRPTPHTS